MSYTAMVISVAGTIPVSVAETKVDLMEMTTALDDAGDPRPGPWTAPDQAAGPIRLMGRDDPPLGIRPSPQIPPAADRAVRPEGPHTASRTDRCRRHVQRKLGSERVREDFADLRAAFSKLVGGIVTELLQT